MNTIKFTNYNSLNIPQTIILKTNNNIEILEEVLYWLEHTTMSLDQIIEIFKDKLKEQNEK